MEIEKDKENTIWYAIFSDFTIKPYDHPSKGLENIYWIKKEDTGKKHITSYENTYVLYSYEILDKSLNSADIELKGWKIKKINDPAKVKTVFEGTYAIFTDKEGEIRREMVYDIDGALDFLKKISIYDNWQNFDLKTTNDDLKEELETLQKERDALYLKVYTFENTLLFKKIKEWYEKIPENKLSETDIKTFCDEYEVDKSFIDSWVS